MFLRHINLISFCGAVSSRNSVQQNTIIRDNKHTSPRSSNGRRVLRQLELLTSVRIDQIACQYFKFEKQKHSRMPCTLFFLPTFAIIYYYKNIFDLFWLFSKINVTQTVSDVSFYEIHC